MTGFGETGEGVDRGGRGVGGWRGWRCKDTAGLRRGPPVDGLRRRERERGREVGGRETFILGEGLGGGGAVERGG